MLLQYVLWSRTINLFWINDTRFTWLLNGLPELIISRAHCLGRPDTVEDVTKEMASENRGEVGRCFANEIKTNVYYVFNDLFTSFFFFARIEIT